MNLPFPRQFENLKGCFQKSFFIFYLSSLLLFSLLLLLFVCLFVWCCFFIRVNIYSRPRRLSHCRKEAVEKIKESAQDTMGRRKVPSSPRPFYFFIILIFIGTPSGSLCGGVRDRFQKVAVFLSGFTSLVWTDSRFL